MSGIFKGDSIYKSGGGSGGGYKDGGELVDADFIEVKNNTISTYENESRDPVNFYFTVTEGEIINSIINLETQVNAVVNVYMYRNGIYYLLGNVGGNTVNASKIYTVNVINESFVIEEVSDNPTPAYIEIADKVYGLAKIGQRIWTIDNLVCDASGIGISGYFYVAKPGNQSTYPGYYYGNSFNTDNYKQANEFLHPFRLPTDDDFQNLRTAANNQTNNVNKTGYPGLPNATNSTGFSSIPCGSYIMGSGRSLDGYEASYLIFKPNSSGELGSYSMGVFDCDDNDIMTVTYPSSLGNTMGLLRLCADV